ncbi:MAG: diaminopimelate epimerase [Actinomycetota bacterium]|nr:diaminopimelate epimerase [Actinomycetota bacterium]
MSADGIPFSKGHGTGNDFVLLPDPDGLLDIGTEQVKAVCDRHFGIGADGVLRVVRSERTQEGAAHGRGAPEWFMDYRNADGSLALMCGNGIRVFARFLVDSGLASPGSHEILTRGGVRRVEVGAGGDIGVDMGAVTREGYHGVVTVTLAGACWSGRGLGMPNPHAVVIVDDLEALPTRLPEPEVGPASMYPDGVNVEFVQVLASVAGGPAHIRMRVHERGSAETLSCGTGACAAGVVAAERLGLPVDSDIRVEVPGGTLVVARRPGDRVHLAGPAELVADGVIRADWWKDHS